MDEGVSKVGQDYVRLREALFGLADAVEPLVATPPIVGPITQRVRDALDAARAALIAAACPSQVLQLLADNERMREALEKIAEDGGPYRSGYCQTDISVDPALTAQEAQDAARAALNPIQTTGDHYAR